MTTVMEPSTEIIAPEAEAFIDEWIIDLEDPTSKQSRGALANPMMGGFCCLGLFAKGLKDRHPEWLATNGFEVLYPGSGGHMVIKDLTQPETATAANTATGLPQRLVSMMGLPLDGMNSETHPNISTTCIRVPPELAIEMGGSSTESLASFNDAHQKTFPEIATIIKKMTGRS